MAKKVDFTNVLARTEPGYQPDHKDLDEGNIKATGIGLRAGELAALDVMATSVELSRNSLMRGALRWFIKQYRAGKVDLSQFVDTPPPQKKKLRLP